LPKTRPSEFANPKNFYCVSAALLPWKYLANRLIAILYRSSLGSAIGFIKPPIQADQWHFATSVAIEFATLVFGLF
jgi:hypothetical protein